MLEVDPQDVLRGLKRCKRLAKQDLLASAQTPDPRYWTLQAQARRETYEQLMQLIEAEGLEATYQAARQAYVELPMQAQDVDQRARLRGREQALDMFFTIIGLPEQEVEQLRRARQQRGQQADEPGVAAQLAT